MMCQALHQASHCGTGPCDRPWAVGLQPSGSIEAVVSLFGRRLLEPAFAVASAVSAGVRRRSLRDPSSGSPGGALGNDLCLCVFSSFSLSCSCSKGLAGTAGLCGVCHGAVQSCEAPLRSAPGRKTGILSSSHPVELSQNCTLLQCRLAKRTLFGFSLHEVTVLAIGSGGLLFEWEVLEALRTSCSAKHTSCGVGSGVQG